MHKIQRDLLALSRNVNLGDKSLREIGALISVDHPQQVSYHLSQLENRGFIFIDRANNVVKNLNHNPNVENRFINIPIVGSANCGPAEILAIENIEGYIQVSKNTIRNKKVFAIKASGTSMDRANIDGKSIEDGDYAIVDPTEIAPVHGGYYLFLLGDAANIKRFHQDPHSGEITLVSESHSHRAPILIHPEDADDFTVNGRVVNVVKQVKF